MIDFYKNKKVLVTGHTGFKGAWLCILLKKLGAEAIGYSLPPIEEECLFYIGEVEKGMLSVFGDIRERGKLEEIFAKEQPEIVFHLAAQPLVRESYMNPVYTYETNVMGTVNILECVRKYKCVKSLLNITTDKVYENKEWEWGYRENEPLDGYDPYSNSKSCSELVTHSYQRSFFEQLNIRISTARAGNVIGGGDFAKDRIIPDCIRAAIKKEKIIIRNPFAVRPFQHVLEPLTAYLMIGKKQWEDKSLQGCYNVGPDDRDCVTAGRLAQLFCLQWGEGLSWINKHDKGPHEAAFLKLDCSKIKARIGWHPVWSIEDAVEKSIQWTKAYYQKEKVLPIMTGQIEEYIDKQWKQDS